MKNDRIYQLTAIGRPLDTGWATNRAVLFLLPLLAAIGAGLAWTKGLDGADIANSALRAALLGFGAWAVARELAPDDQPAAFISMGLAVTTLVKLPEPGLLLLFLALALARVLNRSTGVNLKKTDAAAVLLLAILATWQQASPVPLVVTALTFAYGRLLPGSSHWQTWPAGIALLGAAASTLIFGPGIGRGVPLSMPGLVFPIVFGGGFLLTILMTRQIAAPGDHDGQPLSPRRVRAGMWVVLALATANLAHGRPEAADGAVLWAVFGGVAIGRLVYWRPAAGKLRWPGF